MKRFLLKEQFLGAFLAALVLLALLAACGSAEDEATSTPGDTNPEVTGYPPPGEAGYPTAVIQSNNSAYPSEETAIEIDESQRFTIQRPLTAGDTTVSGTAPSNTAIALVDVTFGGIILGTGVTDDDGQYTIPVSPLPEGHRVGLTVTDIQDGRTFEEIAIELYDYRGEGYINVPTVGVYFDSVMTQP